MIENDTRHIVLSDQLWEEFLIRPDKHRLEFTNHAYRKFPPSWQLSLRVLAQHFLLYIERGRVAGEINKAPLVLQPGNLVWIGPTTPHAFKPQSKEPITFRLFRFRPKIGERQIAFTAPYLIQKNAQDMLWLLSALLLEIDQTSDLADKRRRSLLFLLYTNIAQNQNSLEKSSSQLSTHQQKAIQDDIYKKQPLLPTPQELAKLAQLSLDYFTIKFRNTYGLPPRKWLLKKRIQYASELLAEQAHLTIGQIAEELGYADLFLFSRQFKQVTGETPSAYRNRTSQGNLEYVE